MLKLILLLFSSIQIKIQPTSQKNSDSSAKYRRTAEAEFHVLSLLAALLPHRMCCTTSLHTDKR